ncbi:lipopolysaccharide biosynthesis protein [Olivibacter sp. CPCC 100613]|uniref:lipopolysaccharide biosynthesis protein n=1 Tax=Olivibacter sp. CPCC 100613 TaxID=3079931 RepID=UPI002FF8DA1C
MQRTKVDDEIGLKELIVKLQNWWRYLLSKWSIILIAAVAGAVFGLSYSLWKKTLYKASLSFVLEDQKGGENLSSMANLASLIGISLGGMEGASLFTGDNILEFIKSKRMIEKTLLTKVVLEGEEQLLVERYVTVNKLAEGWSKNAKLTNFKFIPDSVDYFLQDSLLAKYHKAIVENDLVIEKPDNKLSIIQLDITSPDELFAKAFCETLIENVTNFYVETRTKKSAENLEILTKQVDSVRRELNDAIGGVALAGEANPNANAAFQRLRVPSQKRQIDVQANTAILSELVKQQEIAKLNLRNDKPLVQALDKPKLPLEKEVMSKIKGVLLGGFAFSFLTIIGLIVKRLYREIMDEHFE